MKSSFLLAIFLGLASLSYATSIDNLPGTWQVVVCAQGQNCAYLFNLTLTFNVDQSQSSIKNDIKLLNSIKNHYQAYSEEYSYTQNSDQTYKLTKKGDPIPYTLKLYTDKIGVAYRSIPSGKGSNYENYELFGFLREDSVTPHNFEDLIYQVNNDMSGFPFNAAGITLEKLSFQVSASFTPDQLNGNLWYGQSAWFANHSAMEEKIPHTFEELYAENPEGDIYQNYCFQAMFDKNWTNPQIGDFSEYNFIWIHQMNNSKMEETIYDAVFYPDPVVNAWIHGNGGTAAGFIYADKNTLILVKSDKSASFLYTRKPLFSQVAQALFTSQLVKIGINPLTGHTTSFNNTLCNPDEFTVKDLVQSGEKWNLVSYVSPDNEKKPTTGCTQITFTVDEDKKAITQTSNGYDFQNQVSFTKTEKYTYTDINSRTLYAGSQELKITEIRNGLVMIALEGDDYDAALLIGLSGEVELNSDSNAFTLNQFYPGKQTLFPNGKLQCSPYYKPVTNLTTHDLINNKWHELAFYTGNIPPPSVSCAQWKFTQNQDNSHYYDIESIANYKYTTRYFTSTNSIISDQPGFSIPQLTRMHGDGFNLNKTEVFFTTLYYDGTNAILLVDDSMDTFAGFGQFFFISTKLDYTAEDVQTFNNTILQHSNYDKKSYFVVDNKDCGFGEEDLEVEQKRWMEIQ